MIIFDETPTEWDSKHAGDLKVILNSDVMRLALAWVGNSCPKHTDGSDPNKALVAGGRVEGFHEAIKALFALTTEQPVEVKKAEEYPDLDDEAAWPKDLSSTQTQPNQP